MEATKLFVPGTAVTWKNYALKLEADVKDLQIILEELPWLVWEMNDLSEWFMARTRGEAVVGYLKFYDNWQPGMDQRAACGDAVDHGLFEWEEIQPLNDEAMMRHTFRDDDGETPVTRTFAEELARRVAEGPKCELFALSEW